MRLKYGMNPHQPFATAVPVKGGQSPISLLHGTPSLINLLDALNAWALVREARFVLGKPTAASFKHVSPAGVAISGPLDDATSAAFGVSADELSSTGLAYVRARAVDPKSSYGDFAALSDPVDRETAEFLRGVVCDGIIAPGYDHGTIGILAAKKGGAFVIIAADPDFEPAQREAREVFGLRLLQDANTAHITEDLLDKVVSGEVPASARHDLLLGLVAVKYTQSNSVAYVLGGQTIGIGAGQQSRVDATKLAGSKADVWHLRRHPKVANLRFTPQVKTQERVNWQIRYVEGGLSAHEKAAFAEVLERPADPLTRTDRQQWRTT